MGCPPAFDSFHLGGGYHLHSSHHFLSTWGVVSPEKMLASCINVANGYMNMEGICVCQGGTLPCIFKVDKPAIQVHRILCLCKLLVHSPFWESSTVHCP